MQERLVWLENNGYLNNNQVINTRTTKFLMPLIGISEKSLDGYCLGMFINAHIKNKEELLIYVILNKLDYPEESKDYVVLQHLNENFVEYLEEEQEYTLIYQLPKHFKEDYSKVLDGRYSKTSAPYKAVMTRVHGKYTDDKDHLCYVYEALNPTEKKRELLAKHLLVSKALINEISSKPNLDYEIYQSIEQLKTGGFIGTQE